MRVQGALLRPMVPQGSLVLSVLGWRDSLAQPANAGDQEFQGGHLQVSYK